MWGRRLPSLGAQTRDHTRAACPQSRAMTHWESPWGYPSWDPCPLHPSWAGATWLSGTPKLVGTKGHVSPYSFQGLPLPATPCPAPHSIGSPHQCWVPCRPLTLCICPVPLPLEDRVYPEGQGGPCCLGQPQGERVGQQGPLSRTALGQQPRGHPSWWAAFAWLTPRPPTGHAACGPGAVTPPPGLGQARGQGPSHPTEKWEETPRTPGTGVADFARPQAHVGPSRT